MAAKKKPGRKAAPKRTPKRKAAAAPELERLSDFEALETYRTDWLELTPGERLVRSWALRARMPDPEAVHDAKLFPRP